ncbi:MAG: SDR family oxidoreductase [Bacteroidota bacterium]
MKSIALFGGTGRTGLPFLQQALEAGHPVKALARTPEKWSESLRQHPKLTIVQGDVLNQADVTQTIAGSEVVVSLFGHTKNSPEWLQTNGTKLIVAAMQEHKVQRILSLSGGGLPFPEKDQPKFMDHLIRTVMKLFFAKVLNDAIKHHQVLQESGLNWSIVRGPRLTDAPASGSYRVGWVGVDAGTQISRADLAAFLLTLIEDKQYDFQMPFVTN